MAWYLGNLHCHSTRSDGDSDPAAVARFYRDAGFHFVAITDHGVLTGAEHCGDLGGFVVLAGCEYSAFAPRAEGGPSHLHVNAIGGRAAIAPSGPFADAAAGLQEGVDLARAQGALTIVNHPNWHWSFGADELARVRGAHAFELWNGAPTANSLGDAEHASTEAMWDDVLGRGARLIGIASDDAHHFASRRPWSDPPLSGWMAVWAERPTAEALLAALAAGRCVASDGPRIAALTLARERIALAIEPWDRTTFTTTFIGRGGVELARVRGARAEYRPRGDEGYVRCRVETAQGRRAWTQPVFLDDPATWWRTG